MSRTHMVSVFKEYIERTKRLLRDDELALGKKRVAVRVPVNNDRQHPVQNIYRGRI